MAHDFSAGGIATNRISCAFEITIPAATQSDRITTARDIWRISDRAARALRSELPIAWDREFISRDYGKTVRRRPAKGSPLGQVRASPGGEAGPSACRARANTNARVRFLAGDGSLALPPPNLKLVSFAVNSQATVSIWVCGTRHASPGPPLAALAGTSLTILSAIYRKCGSQDLLAGDGPAEDSRGDTGRRRDPGGAGPRARAP